MQKYEGLPKLPFLLLLVLSTFLGEMGEVRLHLLENTALSSDAGLKLGPEPGAGGPHIVR